MPAPLTRVLTVNEVRENIKALREAALHRGAVVHFGERGRDEVVLVAADAFVALEHEARRARQRGGVKRGRKPRSLFEVMRAAGTFDGPADLSEHHDAYIHGRAFPQAPGASGS